MAICLAKPEVQKFIFQLCWRDYFHFYCSLAKGLMRLCVEQGESRNKLQSWPPSIHHDSPVFSSRKILKRFLGTLHNQQMMIWNSPTLGYRAWGVAWFQVLTLGVWSFSHRDQQGAGDPGNGIASWSNDGKMAGRQGKFQQFRWCFAMATMSSTYKEPLNGILAVWLDMTEQIKCRICRIGGTVEEEIISLEIWRLGPRQPSMNYDWFSWIFQTAQVGK